MLGKVALEEAYEHSGLAEKSMRDSSLYIAPWNRERYVRQIQISPGGTSPIIQRTQHGIGYAVVSFTVPGILGIADKTEAEKTATLMNNWIAEHIKEHRDRL
ncbi:hypothetical protein CNMCM6936_000507 [Aspergillus lentulus]|nr:hypothetical protein CNMCM6936_000507 [Aspergillus lentulus]